MHFIARNHSSATPCFVLAVKRSANLAVPLLFLLFSFIALPGAAHAQCAGWCGGGTPFDCYCDEDCFFFGDCCDDVCDECPDLAGCAPPPPPPVNNTCEGALPITEGLTQFSTHNATTTGPIHIFECTENNNPFIFTDIYYIYEAHSDGDLTISTCNQANYNTKIAVYLGDECALAATIIICKDDADGCFDGTTLLTIPVVAGQAYTIRLGGDGASPGMGTLALSLAPACDPNQCPDLTGSGAVGVPDLLELLANWSCSSAPGSCAGDFTCSGSVGVPDLLYLLGQWGECQAPTAEGCTGHCGGQSPDGCWCDAGCFERGDCCLDVCQKGICCTHVDGCACVPFGCDGFCGGDSPDGCSCAEDCFDSDTCCDDVCDECEYEICTAHLVGCKGYCGTDSPDGCACDYLCVVRGDCCEDACDVCGHCEVIYSCEGFCGTTAGGCWCDDLCFMMGDCCNDICETCADMHAIDCGFEPSPCEGHCGGQSSTGCWCDDACHFNLDCCPGVCGACPELLECGGDPPPPPPPPANNTCAQAIEIFEGDTPFSTLYATTDGPIHIFECTENNNPFVFADIYYFYTATADGNLTVSTCNQANYNTKIALYEGTNCDLQNSIIACKEDTPGCTNNTTELTIPVSAGQGYTIRVGGPSASGGTGVLTLTLD